MRVIGVIGGVASGKSAVAEALVQRGARRFDADRAGHDALRDPEVVAALRRRWGDEVLDEQGEVRRGAVAARVFAEGPQAEAERKFLESVTHGKIREAFRRAAQAARADGARAMVVDAALLVEAGWDEFCDLIVFVEADDQLRQQRAASRGWTREQWQSREAAQLPLEEKRRRASHVVSNHGTLEQLHAQLAPVLREAGLGEAGR